jgi:hypothetical protein
MPRIHRYAAAVADLSDAAVKKLIRGAKKRGYVTVDQINAVPSPRRSTEQIEDVLAMFSEMGVNVVENEDAEPEDEARSWMRSLRAARSSRFSAHCRSRPRPTEPAERTDDPVRMYLRRWARWSPSREGEIAIAKRIEAGREAMGSPACARVRSPSRPSSSGATSSMRARSPARHHRSRGDSTRVPTPRDAGAGRP